MNFEAVDGDTGEPLVVVEERQGFGLIDGQLAGDGLGGVVRATVVVESLAASASGNPLRHGRCVAFEDENVFDGDERLEVTGLADVAREPVADEPFARAVEPAAGDEALEKAERQVEAVVGQEKVAVEQVADEGAVGRGEVAAALGRGAEFGSEVEVAERTEALEE